MPLNGSGSYTPPSPAFPAVPNTVIYSNDFNTIILDIGQALSAAFYRDGRAPMAGTLHFNGNGADQIATLAAQNSGGTFAGSWNFSGTVTVTTQSPGDNSTKVASTAYVDAAAFTSALPSQAGNNGKGISTDGSVASWKKYVGNDMQLYHNFGGF